MIWDQCVDVSRRGRADEVTTTPRPVVILLSRLAASLMAPGPASLVLLVDWLADSDIWLVRCLAWWAR